MSIWSKFTKHHIWFCKESRKFVCSGLAEKLFTPFEPFSYIYDQKYKLKDFIYWPIAWIKFMWYSKQDICNEKTD